MWKPRRVRTLIIIMTTHNTENLFVNQRIHFTNWRWKVEFYEGFINYLCAMAYYIAYTRAVSRQKLNIGTHELMDGNTFVCLQYGMHHLMWIWFLFCFRFTLRIFLFCFQSPRSFAMPWGICMHCNVCCTLFRFLPIWAIWYNKCECVIITWPIKYCSWSMLNHLVNCKLNRNRQNDTN